MCGHAFRSDLLRGSSSSSLVKTSTWTRAVDIVGEVSLSNQLAHLDRILADVHSAVRLQVALSHSLDHPLDVPAGSHQSTDSRTSQICIN